MAGGNFWSAEDIEFLRKNYDAMTKEQLALVLGRTECAVEQVATKIGIRKSSEAVSKSISATRKKHKVEIEALRQQLADMTAERDAYMRDYGAEQDCKREVAQKLAATADLSGLILCHVEPVGFEYRCVKLPSVYFLEKTGSAAGYRGEWTKTPIYCAWEPK